VSRESERLNNIITDFLNYSREKTYEFSMPTFAACSMKPCAHGEETGDRLQVSDCRAFNGMELRARVDANKIKQSSGIFATTRSGRCRMAAP